MTAHEENLWQRPRTTRRYLHPAHSERLYTLWAEGKILLGDVVEGQKSPANHAFTGDDCWQCFARLQSTMIWPVHGRTPIAFDFRSGENSIREDGVPVHTLRLHDGSLCLTMETLCNQKRAADCFVKIVLKNEGLEPLDDCFGFVLRSGQELKLAPGSPDFYDTYRSDLEDFLALPPTFSGDGTVYHSALAAVRIQSSLPFRLQPDGYAAAPLCLAPGAQAEITLSFSKTDIGAFEYEREKRLTCEAWTAVLDRLRLSKRLQTDREKHSLMRHLTAQMLQCINSLTESHDVICRQGGLQRLI